MSFFLRQVRVEFGQPGTEGRAHDGLRVAFSLRHTLDSAPSPGTISVWNLAPSSLGELERARCVVRLFAGYDSPKLLMQGTIIRDGLKIERQGVDRVATIQVQDGGRALAFGSVSLAISRPTTGAEVFGQLVDALGFPRGPIAFGRPVAFSQGYAFSGRARDALDNVARAAQARWWVRDGVVYAVPQRPVEVWYDGKKIYQLQDDPTPESAVVLGVAEGNLIGSPTRGEDGQVEAVTLLTPELRPGRPFVIRGSERSDGVYTASEVQMVGDTHGQDWYTIAKGRPRR